MNRFFELLGTSGFEKVEELKAVDSKILHHIAFLQARKFPKEIFLNLHVFKVISPLKEISSNEPCPIELFPAYLKHAKEEAPDFIRSLYLEGVKELSVTGYNAKELLNIAGKLGRDFFSEETLKEIEKLSPSLANDIKNIT